MCTRSTQRVVADDLYGLSATPISYAHSFVDEGIRSTNVHVWDSIAGQNAKSMTIVENYKNYTICFENQLRTLMSPPQPQHIHSEAAKVDLQANEMPKGKKAANGHNIYDKSGVEQSCCRVQLLTAFAAMAGQQKNWTCMVGSVHRL